MVVVLEPVESSLICLRLFMVYVTVFSLGKYIVEWGMFSKDMKI